MLRVSSRVIVRVAALVALLAVLPVLVVELLRLLVPDTALPTLVPMMVAIVAVTAVIIAFQILLNIPGFLLSFSASLASLAAFRALLAVY